MRQIKGAQFTPDFMLESSSDIANGSTNPHNAAYDPAQTYIQCGGASTARVGPIMDGISYLQKLHDDVLCSNGAGPRNCGRISCSWNSAISWCNEKTVPSDAFQCNIFAWYAQEILDDCAIYDQNPRVNGADWDSSFNFTVVVDGAWC
jgi:hypothetical protein